MQKLLPACVIVFFNLFSIASAIETDFLMNSDPSFTPPTPIRKFPPELVDIWLQALQRPEADMQRMAAQSIARGQSLGIPNLDRCIPRCEQILTAETSNLAARVAAARALIALDSRQSADSLFAISQKYGASLRQVVEPKLADWKSPQAIEVWRARLTNGETQHRDLVLAIRSLAALKDESSIPRLTEMIRDPQREHDVRLEAATAVGTVVTSGLEQEALRLLEGPGKSHRIVRLCVVRMLENHSERSTAAVFEQLSKHSDPIVCAFGLRKLNQIDHLLIRPNIEAFARHPDFQVREQAVAAFSKETEDRLCDTFAPLLADTQLTLRRHTADAFILVAEKTSPTDRICDAVTRMLMAEDWRGQEQAALVLGVWNRASATGRLLELLDSPQPEVRIASAWALRKIADQTTAPQLMGYLRRVTDEQKKSPIVGVDDQIAHLFEALAVMKVHEAKPLMLEYVPRQPTSGDQSRGAAIWALGKIGEGQSDESLESLLIDRIRDILGPSPEKPLVRRMCVVSLTRLQAVKQINALRKFAENGVSPNRFGLAIRWALKQLANEDIAEPTPAVISIGSWFLEPISGEDTSISGDFK